MARSSASPMKIALVTTFPPSSGDLNEYGFHLASALRSNPSVEAVIYADQTAAGPELESFDVRRCWRFNSLLTAFYILRRVWKDKPDCVWFNMGFSTFANTPVAAFLSILTPFLVKCSGYYTHITLHTVFERINLEDAQVRFAGAYRMAGRAATQALLWSGDITVLLPTFRQLLLDAYRVPADQVQYRPHGTFVDSRIEAVVLPDRKQPVVLAFGYWGTYQRVEILIAAMKEVLREIPDAVLHVAGKDHPSTPGYLEGLRNQHRENRAIQFLGYVPEEEVPAVFGRARLVVLPYTSAAGTSGVVHQACQHALPIVASDIEEFTEMAREEGVAMAIYPRDDSQALAAQMLRLLQSDETCLRMSLQNLRAASGTPMPGVVDSYLELFRFRIGRQR
ncbi:MAG: glycosyltransferase [Acidobacteriaceae bacterium]|nr:glycosyltransferase [Acidobacteriaceae bacterium]